VALGGGAAVGNAVGPVDVGGDETAEHDGRPSTDPQHAPGDDEAAGPDSAPAGGEELPGGVLVSQAGYTLEAERTLLDGPRDAPFRFRITGPDGTPVRDFDFAHERELHLIIVGRDLTSYAHLHPDRADDGTWSIPLPALAPGAYRAYADFAVTDGPELTLGVDLSVPGAARPAPLPRDATSATVGDYRVTLAGTPAASTESELELTVSRDGEPVIDLEPYLGAAGHLVAIRAGDLAYLHVHPLDEADEANGPGVRFAVEVPSPGDYRLFFDFAHRGEVRTAAFTVHVPAGDTGDTGGADAGGGHGGHD
jgi:hypothetical protein